MRTTRAKNTGTAAVLLYRLTYTSKGTMLGVLLLVCSILLQPTDFVFASESGDAAATATDPVTDVTTEADAGEELTEAPEDGEEPAGESATEETSETEDASETEPSPETTTSSDNEVSEPATDESDTEATSTPSEDQTVDTDTPSTTPTEETDTATATPPAPGGEPITSATNTATSSDATDSGTDTDTATTTATTTTPTNATSTPTTTDGSASSTDTGTAGESAGGGEDDQSGTASSTPSATTTPTSTDETAATTEDEPAAPTPVPTEDESSLPDDDAEPDAGSDGGEEETATSTSPAPIEAVAIVRNDENRYQFGTNECVSVGDGAFYCSEDSTGSSIEEDGVYAAADADGDREIFYRKDGDVTKLTDNILEDAAPFLDIESGEVLYHRLISGRYQIIRYDLHSGEEEQLTDSRENNMEPAQADGVAVWQRWDSGDWEIALYDGEQVTLITDNDHHDVAPTVRDGYVMWHTTNEQGGKLLSVYEIDTGIFSSIADPEGGQVENPRFVLVYDTTYENGDSVTKEYDPKTGAVRPVGTDPAPVPVDIPDPEPAGETRALIQTKSNSNKDELVSVEPSDPEGATTTPEAGTSTATSTTSAADAAGDVDLSESSAEPLELTEYDVVVPPAAASSSSASTSPRE